ncbi:hypothetical protein ACLF30_002527 [Cronobacter sakazakii]|uniref:hypothetical protein n=1 Tax=Cronobacter sakazakii TaxID=28141 RepID=UPI000B4BBDC0|nr:hypothetical protein [Cronobacter sakazakii]EIV2971427.1 hypothetical protein [Cronobacter sakazakii]EJQ2005500.1 hypothetical protein [Cronobacter sakazakii]EJQ2086614.1 hypothetical protein [Cronobacter sakazakii]EJR9310288.1 hypothetical protein [Cronobacter sakazakii]EJR9314914.1 hypothetical protein [Cronobacter sakazakii]
MRKTWFYHHNLTSQQADELISLYQARRVETVRQLSADYLYWIVAALLPETRRVPKVDNRYRHRMWL